MKWKKFSKREKVFLYQNPYCLYIVAKQSPNRMFTWLQDPNTAHTRRVPTGWIQEYSELQNKTISPNRANNHDNRNEI
jgi:hypothetical protein